MKDRNAYALILLFLFCSSCKRQSNTELPTDGNKLEIKETLTSQGPHSITRTIKQDKKGDIWVAAFDGIFRFDGKSFTNMTSEVTKDRFFSVLEDRKGNIWLGSIGSGVYYYDGNSFQNFTTNEGLGNNAIVCIYEDKLGNIWFGANGGISVYDGKSFRNYTMNGDSIIEASTGKPFPVNQNPPHEVNTIIEDSSGTFWFGTRGSTFVYDGKAFTTVTHQGKSFTNVRWIIEDKKGDIWLGGADGLWRYDGGTFTKITQDFIGYIYEDRKGNIWTSSQSANNGRWVLSRYNEPSLSDKKPTATEVGLEYEENKGMIFGILEADDGMIWFGALDGVYRYDGNTITDFSNKEGLE